MSTFDLFLVIYGVVLALTALAVVYRMVVGPTILDRAVSTDSLVVLVVLGMALYTASAKASWAGPAMLGLTGLAFIATVTFARFVAREEPTPPKQRRHREEHGTDTGPLDAIHFDPQGRERTPTPTAPVNEVAAVPVDGDVLATHPDASGPSDPPDSPGGSGSADQPSGAGEPSVAGQSGDSGDSGELGDFDDPDHRSRSDRSERTTLRNHVAHTDHFERGFGAEGASRGFEDEEHRGDSPDRTEETR